MKQSNIDWLLADIREYVEDTQPSLLDIFDIYAAEAVFGRDYISLDLDSLPAGATILEIGSGTMLLSCQLILEGFQVTALEPIGTGFSHFEQMRQTVLTRAAALGCLPQTLNIEAESLTESNSFDYAFSINVMEHVHNIQMVIANVLESLRKGASYRFTCPNYIFPYEPHFNIPTLFSKQLTEKVFGKKIYGSKKVSDASGTWKSLNWINVIKIRNIAQQFHGLTVTFNHYLLVSTIARVESDSDFASRRSPIIRWILLLLVKMRLHYLFRFVPVGLQPIMDCKLTKAPALQVS